MGMMRTEPHQGQFEGGAGCVPLYALRYQLALMRRDEREKALVGFYGHLAHGMTRETFIGGEGCRYVLGADEDGRGFYLPPNSTSNAAWLIMLRYLLIQDWDLDEDQVPDTLRLMYGVPRRWLADGKQIELKNAPTAFGIVSMECRSKLKAGYVDISLTPPERPAKSMLLRAPLPEGWKVDSVEVDGNKVPVVGGDSVDLSGKTKPVTVRFNVKAT